MTSVYEKWVNKVRDVMLDRDWGYRDLLKNTPIEEVKQPASQMSSQLKHGQWPSYRVMWALEELVGKELTVSAIATKLKESVDSNRRAQGDYERSLEYRDRYRKQSLHPSDSSDDTDRAMRRKIIRESYLTKAWEVDAGLTDDDRKKNSDEFAVWSRFFAEMEQKTGRGTDWKRRDLCRKHGLHSHYLNHLINQRRVPLGDERKLKLEAIAQEVLGHGIEEDKNAKKM